MQGLLQWWEQETERIASVANLETLRVKAVTTDCVELPIVRPKPDDFLFGVDYHRSLNLGIIITFYVMFFVFFAALLWLFS